MRRSLRLAWILPVTLALAAVLLWGLAPQRQAAAIIPSFEELILFRYPDSGWGTIATGDFETYRVNDDLPVYNDEGANIRLAVDTAVSRWNETRKWEGGGQSYLFKSVSYLANNKIIGFAEKFGVVIYRLTPEGDCELPDPPAEHCLTEMVIRQDKDQEDFARGVTHELGHALGSLKDISEYDCRTVMSTCLYELPGPTGYDEEAMWEVHGIPSHPSLSAKPGYPTVAVATAQDHSQHDTHVLFYLQRQTDWGWTYDSYYYGEMLGTTYRLEEDVVDPSGPGLYRFAVYVRNQFPNGKAGWIFGGYTNSVYFSSPPPSPPGWVSISGSNGNGSVSWGHVSGATYYEVFVDRWNSGNTVTLLNWVYDTASPRTFSYSVSDYYHAAVKACNANGCSNHTHSNPFWVWLVSTPSPPGWVSISGSNGNGSVSWGHVSGATYYEVFVDRWNNGSTVTLLNWVYDAASPRSFSYSVSDWYHAAVRACNASGCSNHTHSNPFWVWLQAAPLLLLEDYFSSGSINTSLWGTAVGGGATIVQSGGYLQMSIPNVANAYADLYSKSYFAVGTTFEARVWVGSGQSYDHKGIGYANGRVGPDCGSGETQAAMWRGQDRDKYTETKTSSSSHNCWFRESNYPSGWRTIKVQRVSSSQVNFYENGSLIRTHTSYIPTGSLRIRFSAYTYTLAPSDYVTIWVDWVKVTQP